MDLPGQERVYNLFAKTDYRKNKVQVKMISQV